MKVKEVCNGLNAIKEPLLSNDIGKKSQETKTNKLAKTTEVLVKKPSSKTTTTKPASKKASTKKWYQNLFQQKELQKN
jgi:hypothetical protein